MQPFHAFLASAVIALPLVAQEEDHGPWLPDFDQAVERAKKDKKDLLVDFTGSDWCGWCIKLHEEVFAHDEFLDGVKDGYVLVALDFPRDPAIKAKVPNPERNQELAQKYGVQGYPTILLVTPEGDVFGRTGYQPGGPAAYLEHIGEIATKGKQAIADIQVICDAFAGAEAAEKSKVIGTAIEKLGDMDGETPGVGKLAKVVKAAFEVDAKNESGLKLRAIKALLASGQGDDATDAAARELDPKNADGLLEQVAVAKCRTVGSKEDVEAVLVVIKELHELGIKDQDIAKDLYTNGAFWSAQVVDDKPTAKVYAGKALELGVEGRAKQIMEQIQKDA